MATITDRPDVRPDDGRHTQRAGGDRFVGGGFLLLAALFVIVQVLAREVIPPLAVPAVIYAALGALLWRWSRRWLLVAVAALLVLHVASSIPFLAAALAHPETPANFVPDALILIVAVAVTVGAIMGLLGASARRRPVAVLAGLASVLAIVVSVVAAGQVTSDARQDGDVPVAAARTEFPARVEVPAGGATLWVDNQDAFRHTLVVEGTDVHAELPGSTAVRVEADLEPGTYRYYCDVPGHERMTGELVAR